MVQSSPPAVVLLINSIIQDTGLGVRKRVIKLFKSIYSVETSNDRKIDMCTRLVLRMLDEDDTVKVRVSISWMIFVIVTIWSGPGLQNSWRIMVPD